MNNKNTYDTVRYDTLRLAVGNSIMRMDGGTSFYETSVFIFQAPWHHVPESHDINSKCISEKQVIVP